MTWIIGSNIYASEKEEEEIPFFKYDGTDDRIVEKLAREIIIATV